MEGNAMKNIDFKNKSIKVEKAIAQVPNFDEEVNVKDRKIVISDTKTTCRSEKYLSQKELDLFVR